MNAIPTLFKGKMYRSRYESEIAYSLDKIGWEFLYEPMSILLPNCGKHYMPDFYIPAIRLWIEARAYKKEKGEEQTRSFAKYINNYWLPFEPDGSESDYKKYVDNFDKDIRDKNSKNEYQDFLVIKPESILFVEEINRFGIVESETADIAQCKECKKFFIIGYGSFKCRNCGAWDGDHHRIVIGNFRKANEFKDAAIAVWNWRQP